MLLRCCSSLVWTSPSPSAFSQLWLLEITRLVYLSLPSAGAETKCPPLLIRLSHFLEVYMFTDPGAASGSGWKWDEWEVTHD